jgi:cellulose synthase/poly-beta-1,6-N-acetylglucosamine synthase-like glycosyltransferase
MEPTLHSQNTRLTLFDTYSSATCVATLWPSRRWGPSIWYWKVYADDPCHHIRKLTFFVKQIRMNSCTYLYPNTKLNVIFIWLQGLIFFVTFLNKLNGNYASAVQWTFWFVVAVCEAFRFRTMMINQDSEVCSPLLSVNYVSIVIPFNVERILTCGFCLHTELI